LKNRRDFLKTTIGAGLGWAATAFGANTPPPKKRPNFIFVITDDISPEDLGCYGNKVIKTPNIDALSKKGVRFTNAYLSISSCSPTRCSIITGRYPHNTGAAELHTPLPGGQVMFPKLLRDAGYYTVLSGKNHMGKNVSAAFDRISGGKGPGREGDWVEILRDRPKNKPFFCWFASYDAHRKWSMSEEAPEYDPAKIKVPPYMYDGSRTRQDMAGYYHEVSRTDYYLGRLYEELVKQGIEDNTYLIYCSDNGRPFPRCKTRLYDSGIKTPLIIAGPKAKKGVISDSLVSAIDFSATILELATVAKSPRIQGVSFAKLLNKPSAKVRDYVFAEHNWHVFQAHERMVRWGQWLYIRNAFPQRQNLCVEGANTDFMPAASELWQAEAQGKLNPQQRDIFMVPRPAEELYNVANDPHQLNNVADKPENRKILKKLRAALNQWSKETGDTIPKNPTNDRHDAHGKENPEHKRGTMPGTETGAQRINNPGPIWDISTEKNDQIRKK